MATITDTDWNSRLKDILGTEDVFQSNTSKTYTIVSGFLENMINRIGKTVIMGQPNVNDPFSDWTDAVLDYGDAIQKYCIPYIQGTKPDYDPAEPNPYKTVKTNPEVQYVSYNDDVQYKQTIFNIPLKKAFTSANTFGSFTAQLTETMYNSVGLDKFIKWKTYLSQKSYLGTGSQIKDITYDPANEDEYGYALWMKIKELCEEKMRFPNKIYNNSGMTSASAGFDIVCTAKAKRMMDASLKGVYNLEKVDFGGNISWKIIDEFATVKDETDPLDVVILTKGMAHYTPRSAESTALYNPEAYYTNMWYKEAGTFHFDPFYNAAHIYRHTGA